MKVYLGIDVGSVTTKIALVDENGKYVDSYMTRTSGQPVLAVQRCLDNILEQAKKKVPVALGAGVEKAESDYEICAVGTTGSGRNLAGALVGADVIKNEITAHAVAASSAIKNVQTILEIGGQDSKIIILRDGIVTDFAMNTVCAAGTGSFLDHQAQRLNVDIKDFGDIALQSKSPARIAGRCGVFAESDLIHKQQLGYAVEDLLYGLCQALVRNYISNLALGKDLLPTVSFQGGVATNKGMVKAFEEALGFEIVVPDHHQTMGAIGAAMLAMEHHQYTNQPTKFKGWTIKDMEFHSITCGCTGCSNNCEIITILEGKELQDRSKIEKIGDIKGNIIARWGGTCGRWDIA